MISCCPELIIEPPLTSTNASTTWRGSRSGNRVGDRPQRITGVNDDNRRLGTGHAIPRRKHHLRPGGRCWSLRRNGGHGPVHRSGRRRLLSDPQCEQAAEHHHGGEPNGRSELDEPIGEDPAVAVAQPLPDEPPPGLDEPARRRRPRRRPRRQHGGVRPLLSPSSGLAAGSSHRARRIARRIPPSRRVVDHQTESRWPTGITGSADEGPGAGGTGAGMTGSNHGRILLAGCDSEAPPKREALNGCSIESPIVPNDRSYTTCGAGILEQTFHRPDRCGERFGWSGNFSKNEHPYATCGIVVDANTCSDREVP